MAAVRPASLTFVSPFRSYARGRYALIGRSSCHVTPVRLYIRFPFLSHVTLTVHYVSYRPAWTCCLSCLRFLAYASYSSPVMSTHLSPERYAQFSTRLLVSCSLSRLDVILVLYSFSFYACMYLYLPDLYIYWVGDGTIPIFNLLCNHPKVVT